MSQQTVQVTLGSGLVSLKLLHTFQCQHVVCGVEQQRQTRCVDVFEFIETKSEFILTSISSDSTEGKTNKQKNPETV